MFKSGASSTARYLARVGLLALVYFLTARIGLSVPFLHGNVTAVWPPTGVALAALVVFGPRIWPGVAIGALAANAPAVPLGVALGMALGNTLEAVVGAFLLRRCASFRTAIDRPIDVVALVGLAACLSTVVSASIGVGSLALGGVIPLADVLPTWRVWWVGDALGALVVAPALLVWAPGGPNRRGSIAMLLAITGASASLAELAFGADVVGAYLVLPAVVLAAYQFAQRGAVSVTLAVAAVAVFHTANGEGPFAGGDPTQSLWDLDVFLAAFAITGVALGALVAGREADREALEESNRALEDRVAVRTAQVISDRERLAKAQALAHLGSWEWDVASNTITWSDELHRIFGVDRQSVGPTYEDFLARVHPEDRPIVETAVNGSYVSLEPFEFDHRIVLESGAIRWLHGTGEVVTDDAGLPTRMHGTAQDITERRNADRRFESLLEAAPDAIVVVDDRGFIQLVNRQTEALFGYAREELLGQPVEMLVPERFRKKHPELRSDYSADSRPRPMGAGVELAARRRDGSEFPVDISLSPLETDGGLLVSAAIRDVTDRKMAESALSHQATHDALTGLPNRVLLEDRLSHALARAQRTGTEVAVLFIDIDRFKVINDCRGHSVGDDLLRTVAYRMSSAIRPHDTVARFGGDEFVVVTEGRGDEHAPVLLAQRIASLLAEPIGLDGIEVTVSVSIGVALAGALDDAESLLRDADAAMYRAKEAGRDRCVVFDAVLRQGVTARLETENALRRALERSELQLRYQPIVELISGNVVGVEALVRWDHPANGLTMPSDFIPVAEDTGLIVPLGAAVLRQACVKVAEWQEESPARSPISISVNLSAAQLLAPGLCDVVNRVLAESALDPALLWLEITESVLLEDAETSSRVLKALKAMGVRISVDDFGTGYSSLTYLKQFPVDALKIDKSFVEGLAHRPDDRAIVAGVIDLAHAFGLTTVAEGIETPEQLAELKALGCDEGQGHLWSAALTAAEVPAWMATRVPARDRPRSTQTTVLVVEDDRSLRGLWRLVLDDSPDYLVVGEAADGREAVALARHHQPDVVLLDLAMPGIGGLEALPLIRSVAHDTKVIVISGLESALVADRAIDCGAAGFLHKDTDVGRLIAELDPLVGAR